MSTVDEDGRCLMHPKEFVPCHVCAAAALPLREGSFKDYEIDLVKRLLETHGNIPPSEGFIARVVRALKESK